MSDSQGQVTGAKRIAVARGFGWFREGFCLFKQSPWVWMLNIILFVVIMMLMNAVDYLSILSTLFYPVFVGGFMLGCRDLDEGNELKVSHLFGGFQNRAGPLFALGVINLILNIVLIVVIVGAIFGLGGIDFEAMEAGQISEEQAMNMILALLILMLFLMPLIMLFWFAPTLIVLNEELGIIESMKLSFLGCLKNVLPFLLYGVVAFILIIIATVPLALGWLVLAPVLMGTIYAGYKDIFLE